MYFWEWGVTRVVLVKQGKGVDFRLDDHGVLMFRDRVCVCRMFLNLRSVFWTKVIGVV